MSIVSSKVGNLRAMSSAENGSKTSQLDMRLRLQKLVIFSKKWYLNRMSSDTSISVIF